MTAITHEISGNQTWLTNLLQPLQAGDEIILTQHGKKIARLVPVENPAPVLAEKRRTAMERARHAAITKITPGESAARSQDFLYDEYGLPA